MKIKNVNISGEMVLPIIEGGKGIAVSNGITAGYFAKSGAVGTISGTNPDFYDEHGNIIRYVFDKTWSRKEKFQNLCKWSILGGIAQAKLAHDISCGNGRLHLNFLWEAGGTKKIMDAVLGKTKGLIHGIIAGAGLPYDLSNIAAKHNVFYYPIVSSARAFSILWKRSFNKVSDLLGGVVYEDPWLAGGHNGLSNKENPKIPQSPHSRLLEIRKFLKTVGLHSVPIIIAGGVWNLTDWQEYIEDPDLGNIAFQLGTRPLLTKESNISQEWKDLLPKIKKGDVLLNQFSPTGFYSSAYRNSFLQELEGRSERQMEASRKITDVYTQKIPTGNGVTFMYVKAEDYNRAMSYINSGYNTVLRTPDKTIIFVEPNRAITIKEDQVNCMGCLSACRFSGWADNDANSTGISPDPRSFCISKSLQDIAHGGSVDNNLVFSGHNGYRFGEDPWYKDGFVPTIEQLINRLMEGK